MEKLLETIITQTFAYVQALPTLPWRVVKSTFRLAVLTFLVVRSVVFSPLESVTYVVSSLRSVAGVVMYAPLEHLLTMLERTKRTVIRTVSTVAVLLVVMWSAILIYAVFYYVYMPTLAQKKEIILQLSMSECGVESRPCGYPSANCTLLLPGEGELFSRGHPYEFHVLLDIQEDDTINASGMFNVVLKLYSLEGKVVKEAARAISTSVRDTPWVLRHADTLLLFPLHMLGWRGHTRRLTVPLLAHFVEDPHQPVRGAHVEVQNTALYITEAALVLQAELAGLRYVMYQWPLTCGVVGVAVISTCLAFLLLLAALYRFAYTGRGVWVSPASPALHLTPAAALQAALAQPAGALPAGALLGTVQVSGKARPVLLAPAGGLANGDARPHIE